MPYSFAPRLKPIAAVCICLAAFQSLAVHAQQTPPRPLAPVVDNLRGPTAGYIVTLNVERLLTPRNETVRDDRFALRPREWGYLNPRVVGDVQRYERKYGFQVRHVYSSALVGFSAQLTEGQVRALSSEASVFTVEADSTVQTTQLALPNLGGLLRPRPAPGPAPLPPLRPVDSPDTTAPGGMQTVPYGITATGADKSWAKAGIGRTVVTGPVLYIIDTGVNVHPDLSVVSSINFAGGPDNDCNGHGTHVAGTAAARDNNGFVVGVAPGAPIVAVKVLDCNGSGQASNVLKGVDWVGASAAKPNAVANMSLGGTANTALDTAVRNAAREGVLFAIAAGNSSANACNSSPSRVGGVNNTTNLGVLVVAATDAQDREASFSNSGNCVDIWAPGVEVQSTSSTGGTTFMSGTSMSSPHVAGAAALKIGLSLSRNQPAPTASTLGLELKSTAKATGQVGRSFLLGSGGARPVMLLNAAIN